MLCSITFGLLARLSMVSSNALWLLWISAVYNLAVVVAGPSCKHRTFQNHLRVYHIVDKSVEGLEERNAGDAIGDMSFIFGTPTDPRSRGCKGYFDNGVMAPCWGSLVVYVKGVF